MSDRIDKSPEWETISDFFNVGSIKQFDEIVIIEFFNQASRKQYCFQCSRTIWNNILNDMKDLIIANHIINDENRLDGVEFIE